MPRKHRKLFVTSALPYANGSIHLGHLVEYIQTDIWVRFQRMLGNTCIYCCADDTHGTPIMLSAKRRGISPEQLIEETHTEHLADFTGFHVAFDRYDSTNSESNRVLSEQFYLAAKDGGYIVEKDIRQLYCPSCKMFLPDRFVKGICPSCDAPDQYGDSCEVCAATYNPADLKEPRCAECSTRPEFRNSQHYFFKLSAFEKKLQQWLACGALRPELVQKLNEWFKEGLRDWDISRDAPYFGFKIPGTVDKFFYVWLDAPVGYLAALKNHCGQVGLDDTSVWKNGDYEVHHFIGKDILYFHALFWPAMLDAAGYRPPTALHVHGFLTVNGEKMSKSRGTFVLASTYLKHLQPEYLRYYYASKLSGAVEDIDLSLADFVFKVNSDIVNKLVNIGSRLGAILVKKLGLHLSQPDELGTTLLKELVSAIPDVEIAYDTLNYQGAMKIIMNMADQANKYISDTAPWDLAKTDPERARAVCTTGLNALKILAGLLKPVLPELSAKVETFLKISPQTWDNSATLISNCEINAYERLAERIDLTLAQKILEAA